MKMFANSRKMLSKRHLDLLLISDLTPVIYLLSTLLAAGVKLIMTVACTCQSQAALCTSPLCVLWYCCRFSACWGQSLSVFTAIQDPRTNGGSSFPALIQMYALL